MADTKITALTALTAADPANDVIPIVDVSDTSMAASGTTKKISVNNILGASGTATLASATITGDLTVDTSTLKVDSTNNRVGIGTATPTASLQVANGSIRLTDGYQLEFGGTTNSISGSTASNNLVFYTNNLERYSINSTGVSTWSVAGATAMILSSNGLGIGASPSAKLHISDNTGSPELRINGAATSAAGPFMTFYKNNVRKAIIGQEALLIGTGTSDAFGFYNDGAFDFKWFIGSATPAMTLDASGRLLVGTTALNSNASLAVATFKSTSADWSAAVWNSNATPFGLIVQYDSDPNISGREFLACYGAANVRAKINSNGGISNYQANDVNLSDIRTKTDIKPLTSYWNKIKALELVTFKYKDQTHDDDNIGLIAQQVESVAPEFVDVDGFGNTPEDGVPLKTIYTTDLYHAAIKALQEAMTRIEVLESKLA